MYILFFLGVSYLAATHFQVKKTSESKIKPNGIYKYQISLMANLCRKAIDRRIGKTNYNQTKTSLRKESLKKTQSFIQKKGIMVGWGPPRRINKRGGGINKVVVVGRGDNNGGWEGGGAFELYPKFLTHHLPFPYFGQSINKQKIKLAVKIYCKPC